MKNWLLAVRFKTLTASVAPVLVSGALVLKEQKELQTIVFICCLLCGILCQVGSNFFNDALDFKNGSDTKSRLGPDRMTSRGLISVNNMLIAGFVVFFLAALIALPILFHAGSVVIFIGFTSLFFAYTYSGGPFPLAHNALGELFVVVIFGLLAVTGTYYVQTFHLSVPVFVAGLQVGIMAAVIISINNLRDIKEDRLSDKKTLAVVFGEKFSRYKILLFFLTSYSLGFYWLFNNFFWAFSLPFLISPLFLYVIYQLFKTKPSIEYNKFLAQFSILHLIFSLLLGLGIFI